MLISGQRKVSDFFSLFSNFYSLQLWIFFFLQKQPIRAARKEGVIFFLFVFTNNN